MPAITVLMPVFNAEIYLVDSIQSILKQSFTDFELLIINDGSVDKSEDIILGFKDCRIRYYKNEKNRGTVYSLNRGISLSNGDYIARMDADDQCFPERLKLQYEFLEKNNDIGLCGTWFELFNEDTSFSQVIKHPICHEGIKTSLLLYSPIGHPTVMIRRSIFKAASLLYDEKYKHAEDYALWAKLIKEIRFANVPKILLRYRIHDGQISKEQFYVQKEISDRIRIEYIQNITYQLNDDQIDIHKHFINLEVNGTKSELTQLLHWINFLVKCNDESRFFNESEFNNLLSLLLRNNILNFRKFSPGLLRFFFIKKINLYRQFSVFRILKFVIKKLFTWLYKISILTRNKAGISCL